MSKRNTSNDAVILNTLEGLVPWYLVPNYSSIKFNKSNNFVSQT